jgi:Alginate lyase/Esterase PHB depolymerase
MKEGFVAEILRAAGTLRSGDRAGATDIIRAALAAGGLAAPKPGSDDGMRGSPPSMQRTSDAEGGPAADADQARPFPGGAGMQPEQQAEPRSRRLRRSLGETVRTLSQVRKTARAHGKPSAYGTPAAVPVADGAAFRDLHYSCSAGSRRYRLYVPASATAGLDGGLQGMIVMLHGCTQTPEDFAAGTAMNAVAEEHRLLLVYPAQTNRDNQMACWNWFRPEDQARGAGEPAIIAGLTSSSNNHRYLSDSVTMAWGILRGDDNLFRAGIERYLAALEQMRPDGSLPLETARGARALSYQRHAIASLVAIAEMAAAQGYDLYGAKGEDGQSIHRAIAFLLDGIDDPALVWPYAMQNETPGAWGNYKVQDLGFMTLRGHGRHYMAWTEAYIARFPDSELALRLRRALDAFDPAAKPLIDEYSGGNMSCFFSLPEAGEQSS